MTFKSRSVSGSLILSKYIHVNCLEDGYVMYNVDVIVLKRGTITNFCHSMIPEYCCEN